MKKTGIAEFIKIFHDIARFKQYTKYRIFKDNKNFDNGYYSAIIVEENHYFNKFTSNEKYKKIINKDYSLEEKCFQK